MAPIGGSFPRNRERIGRAKHPAPRPRSTRHQRCNQPLEKELIPFTLNAAKVPSGTRGQ